jgi:hypothetical protein
VRGEGVIKQDATTWLRKRDDEKSFSDHVARKCAAKIVWKLTNSLELSLLQKSPVAQMIKNFPTFYLIRMFITVSSTGPYPEPDESSPYPSIFTSPSHLRQGILIGLFPSGFPTKALYVFLFSPCVLLYSP